MITVRGIQIIKQINQANAKHLDVVKKHPHAKRNEIGYIF